jgi:hypothetical protein
VRVWGIKFGNVDKNNTNVFNIVSVLVTEKRGCMMHINNTVKGHQSDHTMGFIFPFLFV